MMEVAIRPVFDEELRVSLAAAGVDEDAVAALEIEHEQDPEGFWSLDAEALEQLDGFSRMIGFAARAVIREHYESGGTREATESTLPERPPYLRFNEQGVAQNYDPGDMTQVYRDETAKIWRWVPGPAASLRWRQVMEIPHVSFDGVQVPDDDEAVKTAIAGGYDWFLRGFGTYRGWITRGGKTTFRYEQADRMRYLAVLEQHRSGPLPASALG